MKEVVEEGREAGNCAVGNMDVGQEEPERGVLSWRNIVPDISFVGRKCCKMPALLDGECWSSSKEWKDSSAEPGLLENHEVDEDASTSFDRESRIKRRVCEVVSV